MMNISRRKFLKYCIGSAASLGLAPSLIPKLARALNTPGEVPNIIWIEGASCSGCSVSLANLIGNCSEYGPTDFADLLFNYMKASFAKTFMTAAGDLAVESQFRKICCSAQPRIEEITAHLKILVQHVEPFGVFRLQGRTEVLASAFARTGFADVHPAAVVRRDNK